MFTDLECKYSFLTDLNFSAYLNIDRETTKILLEKSITVVFDFMKAILIDKEYENFKRGYLLRFLKAKIRNIKVIMEYYMRNLYNYENNDYMLNMYNTINQSIYNIECFFKDLLTDIYKLEENKRNNIYKNFCIQDISVVIYLSIQFFN